MLTRVTIETTTTGLCCLHQADAVAQSQVFYNRYYRPTSTELHLGPGAEGGASWRLSAAGAAQEERECVTLLAGQRRGGIDQPGDVGIQAGLPVIFRVPVVVVGLVVLAARGRGEA